MQDSLLTALIRDIDLGRLPELPMWLATPGGVFAGYAISTRDYYERVEAHLRAVLTTNDAGAASLAVAAKAALAEREALPRYAFLRDAHLLNAGSGSRRDKHGLGLARIDLEQVHAWSFYGPG
jgi:hypothetical protein